MEKRNDDQLVVAENRVVKGYLIPESQISKPIEIKAGKPKKVWAGIPVISKVVIHGIKAVSPSVFKIKTVPDNVPGQINFSLPRQIKTSGTSFLSKPPEVALAENPGSKDMNPHGFSFFGTIQGLKTNQIRSLLQDRNGNLWFSSDDGVTRYDGKYLSHFDISNGLHNNNIVLCMLEDKNGSLWFGTFGGGILKFDGKTFTQYTEKEGLGNNIVNCIIQDRAGNYWIGTSGGGVSKFDGSVFTNYSTKEGLSSNQVRSLLQDKDGAIWIGTFGKGLSRFDGKAFRNYTQNEGFPITHIASILQDLTGNLWIGSYNQGIIKFNGKTCSQYTTKQGLSNNTILCMVQEPNGIFWLGTSGGGISRFDGKGFYNFSENDGLTNSYVRCSIIGRQGNLWFGTRDGGLVRFNKSLFTHYSEKEGLGSSKVLGILRDKKGNHWFGCFGGGITRYDGKEFVTYSLKESFLNDYIYTFLEGEDGSIWFGSDGGGITRFDGKRFYQYTVKEGLCHNSVRCMIRDRHKQIWIGTYGGGVSRFNGRKFVNYSEKEGLSSNKVLSILEDRVGNIWFGTDGGGVTRFDGEKFTRYSIHEGWSSNTVTSIIQDRNDKLWFGTSGGGVLEFDGLNLKTYTKNDGLSNDYVNSLYEDRKGNIWIGTRFGPNILNYKQIGVHADFPKPLFFKTYSYDDGFLGIGCNLGAILEDPDGTVWIGSSNRLTAIQPEEETADTIPPVVQITHLKLFHENIPWTELGSKSDTSFFLGNGIKVGKLRFNGTSPWYFLPENLSLSYNNNFVSFGFIGISQKQPQKIRYQYQLQGLDNYWSAPVDLTEISYANLKPGDYVFKLKAMNAERIWSKETTFEFSIRPPWWQTKLFYALLILVVLTLAIGYHQFRNIEHELHKKLLNKIIDEQTHELKEKNQELEKKNDELQTANSEKDKFFSIIAHDVRGPLSTFLSFTEIMAENLKLYSLDEIQVMADSMKKSASTLFELLENLLEWARMQRGLILYKPEPISLGTFLDESVETVRHSANQKMISVDTKIPPEMIIIGDRIMLGSVFRNLTSNAVKFTERGGKIVISALELKDGNVEIVVKDNGIGMESQMLEDLFRIDVYSSRSGTDGETSNGLGLLLCKDFIERQNGRIWVESEQGKGSTFHFTLKNGNQA